MGLRQVEPLPHYEPEIGRGFWALEETRRRTLSLIRELDNFTLDWEGPDSGEDAIGSLLYHVAFTETWWLFQGILQQDFPSSLTFGFPHRNRDGRLTRVRGVPMADHLDCLHRSREFLLEACRSMSLAEWRRFRHPADRPDCEVTPEWIIFHLLEHEAGRAFQILALKARAARFLASERRAGRPGTITSGGARRGPEASAARRLTAPRRSRPF